MSSAASPPSFPVGRSAGDAPDIRINFDPAEDKAIIKFERKDVDPELLDTYFEVWGIFMDNGVPCRFVGWDDIIKLHEDEAPAGSGENTI